MGSISEPSSRLCSSTCLRMSVHYRMLPGFLCAFNSHGSCRCYVLKHPLWQSVGHGILFCEIGSREARRSCRFLIISGCHVWAFTLLIRHNFSIKWL
ncbi:hypothetical protein HYPSUDRAFT_290096 [Hypholoma sublateritium FD-334 SS-4]|uniref:Uncharacterized protein n=1 Tax=Hypholoma sublateritium (strain FD-334 SS-4) TaxID=945553 RepID=A0A0D2NBP9_HYPSF|nr:hypothetical protein HYPSUDRAFT_290096 [Hypholoma sublateritium FD-334 SS-4]